eukprot:CAMPEP_0174882540 /NCGR_PEP_ID=MMETSP1114-20130205/84814_1 /TAXON_ID=312471 /ORGANISM="Neobodo designis, Strain CCAP 1951/1" /LENGTH=697 /DNA_ID=CAMNT_0016117937 /DNA_START=10 /DNA_END=2103 /DNA_ORIENTATION=-
MNVASMCVSMTCSVNHGYTESVLLVLFGAAATNVPRRGLWIFGLVPPYALAAYNARVARSYAAYELDPIHLDGVYTGAAPVARAVTSVAEYAIGAVLSLALWQMHTEYSNRICQARASARVAARVADCLRRYDTSEARAAVGASIIVNDRAAVLSSAMGIARQNRRRSIDVPSLQRGDNDGDDDNDDGAVADADPHLVASLVSIIANLEMYRPHLPNWLVNGGTPRSALRRDSSINTGGSRRSVTFVSDLRDRGPGNGSFQPESTVADGRRYSALALDAGADAPSEKAVIESVTQVDGPATPAATIRGFAPTNTFRRVANITRARLCVVIDAGGPRFDPARLAAVTSRFVDAVHNAARHTSAAVHSFVGDSIDVTWNAAAPAAVPGAKATRFLARTKTACQALQSDAANAGATVVAGGAALSGVGRIQMAGRGEQRALVVSTPGWGRVLDGLAELARDNATFLTDAAAAAEAIDVETRGIASVFVGDSNEASSDGARGTASSLRRKSQQQSSGTDLPVPGVPAATLAASSIGSLPGQPIDSSDGATSDSRQRRELAIASSPSTAANNAGTEPAPSRTLAIHEVVGMPHRAADEWLYVPAPTRASENGEDTNSQLQSELTTSALKLAQELDFTAAYEQIRKIPKPICAASPLLKQLRACISLLARGRLPPPEEFYTVVLAPSRAVLALDDIAVAVRRQ